MKDIEKALLIEIKELLGEIKKSERNMTVYFFDLQSEEYKLNDMQLEKLSTQNILSTSVFQKIERAYKAINTIIYN